MLNAYLLRQSDSPVLLDTGIPKYNRVRRGTACYEFDIPVWSDPCRNFYKDGNLEIFHNFV